MILGRNLEHDETTCHVKNDKFGFLTFVVTSPTCLNLILCPLCYTNTLRNTLMILSRNVEQGEVTCWVQNGNSDFLTLDLSPFLCLNLISCPLCNSNCPSQYFDDT